MAENNRPEGDRRLSLRDPDLLNTTKAGAIDALTGLRATTQDENLRKQISDFLASLENNAQEPNTPLEPADLQKFLSLLYQFRPQGLEMRLGTLGFEVIQRAANVHTNHLQSMEDDLTHTKQRLQEALNRIKDLNSDVVQLRQQLRTEQDGFQTQLQGVREEKRRQQQQFEEEIRNLKAEIRDLEKYKDNLEKQIRDLRVKLQEEKECFEKYKHDNKRLVEQISDNSMKEIRRHQQEIEELKVNVDLLMEENRKLKTRDPYKLVANAVTKVTNALYCHVHPSLRKRKNYYAVETLQSHLVTKYAGREDERRLAEKRWTDMSQRIGWTDDAATLLGQLAEQRERGNEALRLSVGYEEFTEAVRIMYNQNELDEEEMALLRDLYLKCLDNLPLQQ